MRITLKCGRAETLANMFRDPAYALARNLPFGTLPINCYITRNAAVPMPGLPSYSHAMQGHITEHGVVFQNSWGRERGAHQLPGIPPELSRPQGAQ